MQQVKVHIENMESFIEAGKVVVSYSIIGMPEKYVYTITVPFPVTKESVLEAIKNEITKRMNYVKLEDEMNDRDFEVVM